MADAQGKSTIFTGARAKFTINGKKLGWASGVDVSEDVQQEPVDVLDRFEPYEYAPVSYRVSLSARYFKIPRESLVSHGIFTMSASNSDELRRNILNQMEMEAQILDVLTNTVVGRVTRVKPASRNMSIGPRGLVGENVTFTAIYYKDEGVVGGSGQ